MSAPAKPLPIPAAFPFEWPEPEFESLPVHPFPIDPKSRLQEMSQSRYQMPPQYRLVEAVGPDHARRFTVEVLVNGRVMGTGEGLSKQEAEKEAAREALARLEDQLAD